MQKGIIAHKSVPEAYSQFKPMPEQPLPENLRKELIRIAILTDVAGEHNLKGWRMDAVCAARWLLRAAAVRTNLVPKTRPIFKLVKSLSDRLSNDDIPEFIPSSYDASLDE